MTSTLKHTKLYLRLKTSILYDVYWSMFNKRLIDQREGELDFYRKVLTGFQPGDLVFDVGANSGDKTNIFLRMGARVVAVEPQEQCRQVLRGRFLSYRIRRKPVVIVNKAASDKVGVEKMWIEEPGSALNTLSRKWADALHEGMNRFGAGAGAIEMTGETTVETTTLDELREEYGAPFYVKIDIEGYEIHALKGLRQTAPYLSFEVNLPEFRKEGLECIALLANMTDRGQFNYTSDCTQGLALENWLNGCEFAELFEKCVENSVEIFWRTPQNACA